MQRVSCVTEAVGGAAGRHGIQHGVGVGIAAAAVAGIGLERVVGACVNAGRHAVTDIRYVSESFNGDATDDLFRPVKQWQARQASKDLSKVTIRGLLSEMGNGSDGGPGGWSSGGTF